MRDLSRRDFGLGLGLACLVAGRPGSAAAADKLDQLRKSGVVRLGVANQPPYSMVTPEGVATGIAPEVVRAVMAKLGVPKVEAVVAPYGLLIPGLQAGRWDMIGAAMTITKARCSQVLYTDPVTFDGGIMAYVAGDIPTKPESLSSLIKLGYSVGVLTGSYTIKKLLDVGVPRSAISQFEDNPALIDGLLAKRVQVAFSTFGAIRALKKTRGGFETVYPLTEDPPRGSAPAFSLADAELHAAFQKELRALKASGEFLKISTAFGFEVPPGMLNLTPNRRATSPRERSPKNRVGWGSLVVRPTTDPPSDGDPSPRGWLGGRGLVARQETTFANFEVNVGDRRLLTDSESVTLLAVAEGSIRVGNDNVWDSLDADQCGLFVSDRVTMIEGQSGASTHVSLCTVPRSASPLFTGTTGSLSIAHKPMSESIPTLFALGRRLARSESPDDVKLLQVIGDAIFRAFVVEAGVEHVSITPSQAGRAKSYIDDHFARQIDLTQVAAAVGVRKERLVTIFRQSFGITPMRYLRDRRTHEAVRLVRETSMTLADVAQATGYKNEFHLSREIKRLAGASPRSLRRQKG